MIVSCPACSARYRIDSSKIKGRGAKITCPRCGHKFVVYKDRPGTRSADPPTEPLRSTSAILNRDFRRVGVTWRVRKGAGVTYSFHDLASLMSHIDSGRVSGGDGLSYDARTWVPIDSIDDLRAYFEDIWRKAERGEIGPASQRGGSATPSYDEEEEGPTTIMGHGHALMDDIRKAVAEATTPPPSPSRDSDPTRTGIPRGATGGRHGALGPSSPPSSGGRTEGRSGAVRDAPGDDPTTFSRRAGGSTSSLTPSTSDVRAHRPGPASPTGTATPRRDTSPPAPERGGFDRDTIMTLGLSLLAIFIVMISLLIAANWLGIIQIGPGPGAGAQPAPQVTPRLPAPRIPDAAPPSGAMEGPAPVSEDTDEAPVTPRPVRPASPGDPVPVDPDR